MSDPQKISWRVAMDGFACAIYGCDQMASGWISLCGKFITGQEDSDRHRCHECVLRVKKESPLDIFSKWTPEDWKKLFLVCVQVNGLRQKYGVTLEEAFAVFITDHTANLSPEEYETLFQCVQFINKKD